jgi:hypothetical protein
METKICNKCKKEKEIIRFYFRKDTQKLREVCNTCYKGYEMSRLLISDQNKERFKLGILKCTKCNIEKDLTQFCKDRTKPCGYVNQCKQCRLEYRTLNKQTIVEKLVLRKYNLTPEKHFQMLKDQDNKCAICKSSNAKGRSKKFHIDHDHKTGNVRGLLCHHCNVALGSFFDNTTSLQAAIDYLNKSLEIE